MKTLLVSGASRGIGKAVCLEALKRGYKVHAIVRKLETTPPGCTGHVADIRDRVTMGAILEKLAPEVDLFLANAGIEGHHDPRNADSADIAAEVFEVNGTATAYSVYRMAHEWVKNKCRDRRLAVVSSMIAGRGVPQSGAYCATKTAEYVMCQSLEFDLKEYGIGVSVIQPGFIDTDLTQHLPQRPFLLTSEQSAEKILDGLERGKFRIAYPFGSKALTVLKNYSPYFLYRWMMVKYAQK